MVIELLLVVHPLRHVERAALDRPRQLQVHVRHRPDQGHARRRHDPYFWTSVQATRSGSSSSACRCACVFGMLTAMLLTRPKRGVNTYRTHVLHAVDGAARRSRAGVRLPAEPHHGARQPAPQPDPRRQRAAVVLRPGLGQAGAAHPRAVGHRRRHRHLPRRPAERAARTLRGDLDRGRQRLAALPPRHAAADHAGDLLHRSSWASSTASSTSTRPSWPSNVASGQTSVLGAPQNSLLFYGIWLYEQAFRYFHMGYASAMAWVLFAATMTATVDPAADLTALGALRRGGMPIATGGDSGRPGRRGGRQPCGARERASPALPRSRSPTTPC